MVENFTQRGRGAWPGNGRGGTLNFKKGPGPYYLLGRDWQTPGLAAVLRFVDGQQIPFDELAVHYGVKAIQQLLNDCEGIDDIKVDGIFGQTTSNLVKEFQKRASIAPDGIVGRTTMKNLLFLPLLRTSNQQSFDWRPVWGILESEGNWDPGAVGSMDDDDLGLAQVNVNAHPSVTTEQAFDPMWALNFIVGYLKNASTHFDGNIRDTVASYNLGITGAKQWIADGRPDIWQPSWSKFSRTPNGYINQILDAHKQK